MYWCKVMLSEVPHLFHQKAVWGGLCKDVQDIYLFIFTDRTSVTNLEELFSQLFNI